MRKYFKLNSVVGVTDYVLSWQSKGLSNEVLSHRQHLIIVSIRE